MTTPYRAENVGSFLRSPELLEARAAHLRGQLNLKELRRAEDRAVHEVFLGQRDVGLPIFTDGEVRRGSWLTDMADAVDGFVQQNVMLEWKGPGGGQEGSTAQVVGSKLRKLRKMTAHELPLLKQSAPGPFKITLPSPSNFMVSSYRRGITDRFYPAETDLLKDLVEITGDEIRWLVSEGVNYIQFDAPYYSHYLDPTQRDHMRSMGLDPDVQFDKAIAADNEAFGGAPPGKVRRAAHICRGNSRSRWYTEGGYDAIAEKLFGSLDVDAFLLEYDTERAGSFEPLRLVPQGKTVVLGLVTTKQAKLESQDDLRRRIDMASRYVPLENLALSTQCGFASVAAGNLLSIDDQWQKLALVVDTARKVWG